jgi:protein dithiol oxidoreductase (disulfide-forming)
VAGRMLVPLARLWPALLATAFAAAAAPAQDSVRARQNIEYRLIAPQPVETGDKLEVIDFFWYGCPYCNELQPALEHWLKRKPDDVTLRRIPAILRESWAPDARLYYTLELLGEAERLHLKVYDGYHLEALPLSRPEVGEQWAVRNGIDRRKWLDAYHSPEVDARVARARQITQRYEVQVTPSVVVDGRYLTSSRMAQGVSGVVPVVEDLVRLARQRRGAQ